MTHWKGAACGVALLALTASAAHAQIFLADYQGLDYVYPGGVFQVGSNYEAVSFLTVWNDSLLLGLDNAVNEYTCVMHDLVISNVFEAFGVRIVDFTGGVIDLVEDPLAGGTAGAYDPNPPNATVPAHFLDGTVLLTGTFVNFQIVEDLGTGLGTIDATLNWTGGSQLVNIPVELRGGWVLAGTNSTPQLPAGYVWQVDGELLIIPPTATRATSWGGLKALYR